MMTKNILIVGVGGQGTLLASKVMGKVFLDSGYDVKVSEVHGMSQRGGSVVTYVRYGDEVYSTLIDKGEADILLSFEALEAARWLPYLKKDGVVITNTQRLNPMSVVMGKATYPDDILEKIKAAGVNPVEVDALALAEEAGSAKSVNVVLLGIAAKHIGLDKQLWLDAVKSTVPPKTVDMNVAAFEKGYELN
ncbi:MAG: indolepyruvate oxidoreductase subunit beta [Ruminococcus sp.]|nr:indolepyruvate oxidoreductase subunit beta [Ruminococcus sp.]MDD6301534.1 indolepyruvate oxidoreductase subunit beta [Ruminococcus sp.]MDD7671202.1 indolepyruvate oxidoreductase subunit beta [Ruminococcus sp.]MDY2742909.1 indolepyruvate oxidoreductase subunit beta [Eubacteriales bacterium]